MRPRPGVTWSCPNGGALGSGANPPAPTILSGVYVCTSEVSITGTLTVFGFAAGLGRAFSGDKARSARGLEGIAPDAI